MSERRKNKRWGLQSEPAAVDAKSGSTIGYLSDISLGGMMLVSNDPLQTNIVMPLTVDLSNKTSKNEPLKVVTTIVRCNKDHKKSSFKSGLKLVDVALHELKAIELLIAEQGIDDD